MLSPETALQRLRARLALDSVREEFAYDAAKVGRRTSGWFRSSTSANAEISGAMLPLRDGAREQVRNNALAAKFVLEMANRSVGTGILPRAKTGTASTDKILDRKFSEWSDAIQYPEQQRLAVRSIVEAGESLVRFRPRLPSDGLPVPFDIQLLEPDWIDERKTEALSGGWIIHGVEFDLLGREVAIWILPNHPGDAFGNIGALSAALVSKRLPLNPGYAIGGYERGYRRDRAGQVRGVSWFAPVLMALWDLAGYETAERVRKRMEACLAAFITGPVTGPMTPALGQQTKDAANKIIEELRPGMISRLENGATVTMAEPKSAGGYGEYVRVQHRIIAAGLGIPYEILTGDLSQVNYSSYRGGLIGFKGNIESFQWNDLIPYICTPVWKRFIDACVIAGVVKKHPGYGVEWGTPKFDLLDRLAEAEADEREIRIGTKTWPQAVAAQGLDPITQLDEIQKANDEFDKRGIILDCDPRKTNARGVIQPVAEPAGDPPAPGQPPPVAKPGGSQ